MQHQLQQPQMRASLDATEPRGEVELSPADNLMAVANFIQQDLRQPAAGFFAAPAGLPDVPQPPPGVLAAPQHPAAFDAAPLKAPPVGAPPGMGPAGASPLISANVAAQLLATAQQDGTSALMAALNAA